MKSKGIFATFVAFWSVIFCLFLSVPTASAQYYESSSLPHTVGATVYGSFQLVETDPLVSPGIGGGLYWDYRANDRFSLQLEAFVITQDGRDSSSGEGSIEFFGMPTTTFKLYVMGKQYRFDPYIGAGVGFYWLTEGSAGDDSGGLGLGAQIELGVDYHLHDNLVVTAGGTYRSIGLINSLDGANNAGVYMPYTLFGRIGYRF